MNKRYGTPRCRLLLHLLIACCGMTLSAAAQGPAGLYGQNRAPLQPNPYLELPLGAIHPRGWLKEQLLTMKNGMTGHLDSLYAPVVGPRNGWLGGDGDVWERGPYWLDGLLPLAYILDDDALKAKVRPWIEWSLSHQQPDGYFGPMPPAQPPTPETGLQKDKPQDWWPKMVMLKVLKQYYEATGDRRVITLMTRYFHYQLKELPAKPLDHWSWWGAQRGGDNLMVVYWLYNITGDSALLALGDLLHAQTFDWTGSFLGRNELPDLFHFHGVNLAQGIKQPVIYYQQHPEEKYLRAVETAFSDIRRFVGQPQGMFGADELTHGNGATQGSELCTAVELMFSLEQMMAVTGNVAYMDHLEKVAFNALPTQATDDYMARQYYQQPNQVLISRRARNFVTTHGGTDQVFGLLSGYPCCTCNMHQGWPKFTQHLWMASADSGVAALAYAPSDVRLRVGDGTTVSFTEETGYPFEETVAFTCHSPRELQFPFHLRIPGWCDSALIEINGRPWRRVAGGRMVKVDRRWREGDRLVLTLPMQVRLSRWQEHAVAVERGPLVYALKIGERWQHVDNDDIYGSYMEVFPTTPWNYGLLAERDRPVEARFQVIRRGPVGDRPWSQDQAPVIIRTRGVRLPDWTLYKGDAGPLPYSPQPMPKGGHAEEITLLPYGCTTLRISEFPVVR